MKLRARLSRGQMAVIMTLVIGTLIGAVGLGTDIALLYFNWVQLQKGADAAVLAGAGYLPSNTSEAQTQANSFANTNGVKNAEITSLAVAADNMSISMMTSRLVPYYFLNMVGLGSGTATAFAKAGIEQNPWGLRGLIPVGLPCDSTYCAYTPGTEYQLVQAGANGSGGSWNVGPGNWGRLALGAPGATQFQNNLENGYQGPLNLSATQAETGQVNGPTSTGVDYRVSLGQTIDPGISAPPTSLADAPTYDPRLVAVPLVNFDGVTGTSVTVPIVGIAIMWIDSYTSQGPNKTLNAVFLSTIPLDQIPSSTGGFGSTQPILLQ